MTKQARGIRNNNPGNIDYNKANNWKGQLPHDPNIEPRFCRFESPVYGIRALMALLRTYQRKYGLKTVSGLIDRWAPTNENNTRAYINGVAKELGVSPTDVISLYDKATTIKL
ncbi:structural protein, partial [Providencia stuartii]